MTWWSFLIAILLFGSSSSSPLESSNRSEQLSQKSILDLLQQLKSEISTIKVKNQEQDREILQLKQKVAVFESTSSPFQDDTSAARKGDSAKLSSSSAIPSAITGPSSCQEISNLNQDLRVNGFYIVKNAAAQRMMVVYCSFDGPVGQTTIGNLDIKLKEVHFYYQRTTSFTTANAIIPFDLETLNEGNAMDPRTGIFTAPVAGTYHFTFSGIKDGSTVPLNIELQLNGFTKIGLAYATNLNYFLGLSIINASLKLKAGDKVNLYKSGSGILYDAVDSHYTHFTGWLQEEDLSL